MSKTNLSLKAVVISIAVIGTQTASAATYAPWLSQIGINDSIMSAANWGRGQILGVVDTGIVATNKAFAAGQVSVTQSSCAATTFKCTNGVTDDNSHGTAVAAIAAGNYKMPFATSYGGYTTVAGSQLGVAPNANIVAEKVLNASGAGYSTDIANGLIKAANAGASVINLSLTFGNTADLVAAINYAAGKGSFIVWAGGNSAVQLLAGANTNGLTAAAISHLVLVGSVSPKNTLSTFSNTPGTGSLVNTAGAKTAYSARWITAPGEVIVAPAVTSSPTALAYWSGTSMSAPVVSGSLILLESAWPILKTKGTAANLLLGTATDLGTKGIDATYGTGMVNLATAFQPVGSLSVAQANGKTIAVTSLTGTLISGGALGSMASIQSKLANYTALDTYQRNFSVNLSGMIKAPTSAATRNALPTNVNTGPAKMALAGGELAYAIPSAPDRISTLGLFGYNEYSNLTNQYAYAMFTDAQGATMAFGYGNLVPVQYSYARALFGSDEAALSAGNLSTHLNSLSQGGSVIAYGAPLNSKLRIAASFSNTAKADSASSQGASWATPNASSVGAGVSYTVSDMLQLGFSYQSLNENHGLLGSAYDPSSSMSFGNSNRSVETGVSALITLDRNNSLYLESTQSTTYAATATSGSMFSGTSDIQAQSFGMSFTSKNMLTSSDKFTATVKQPLRVTSGVANLTTTTINPVTGVATVGVEGISMAPNGREIDYSASYDTPLSKTQNISLVASYMKDAMNMAGNNYTSVGANWQMKF